MKRLESPNSYSTLIFFLLHNFSKIKNYPKLFSSSFAPYLGLYYPIISPINSSFFFCEVLLSEENRYICNRGNIKQILFYALLHTSKLFTTYFFDTTLISKISTLFLLINKFLGLD
jgi:hypothetical protein